LLLRVPDPYDFELSTERLRAFGSDLANPFHDGALHRVLAGREVRIAPTPGGVEVEPCDTEIRLLVEKLLGLEFDLGSFRAWASDEPVLEQIVRRFSGLRPPLLTDPFESLVTSISAQQVSLRSALALRNRLTLRFGERGVHAYAFPRRDRLAEAREDELVSLGFTRRKAEYVIGLARADLDLAALASASDEEVRAVLTSVRGLGPWSAEWFLARHLARPRAWPAGDLVLRKAADLFYGSEVRELGRRLDPFQNLSAQYLLSAFRIR
jgi:3-methyladenine DNA glycosylase/8-oxoguanine DNA glycosylase